MFINRPLIHGKTSSKDKNHRNSSIITDSKNKIRIKTQPNNPINNSSNRLNDYHDISVTQPHLIGIKNIKDMMDGDIQQLIKRLQQLQINTEDEYKKIGHRYQKVVCKKQKNTKLLNQKNKQKQIRLEEGQQQAYNECRQLLIHERVQQQRLHDRFKQQMSLKYIQFEQRKMELQQMRKNIMNQMTLIKGHINKIQNQMRLSNKKRSSRYNIIQQIQEQRKSIKQMNGKLYVLKQQSIKQKNSFVQIQADEIKIIQQLQIQDQQDIQFRQVYDQFQYLKKLQKLKIKLLKIKNNDHQQIDQFFNLKINNIVKIRIKNDHNDQQIEIIKSKIQEQQAIIQMLSKKHQQLSIQQQTQIQTAQSLYKVKYNQIFLNNYQTKNKQVQTQNQFRELNHWQNYKVYLQKILKNQQRLNALNLKNSRTTSFVQTNKNQSQVFDQQYDQQIPPIRRNSTKLRANSINNSINKQFDKQIRTPSNNRLSSRPTQNIKSKQIIQQRETLMSPLPKLVKMQGKLKDKDKIKNQLTRFTNEKFDEDIELETVRTSQADGEDVIEVQFKVAKSEPKEVFPQSKVQRSLNQLKSKNQKVSRVSTKK